MAGLSLSISGEKIKLYDNQYALVIGNSEYETGWPRLANAVSDVREVSSKLKDMGFTVWERHNLDSQQMREVINQFIYTFGQNEASAILVYFAGHGETELAANDEKLGYILPVDTPLLHSDPIGFSQKALSMNEIQTLSLKAKSRHVLMIFDSCFSGSVFSMRSGSVPPVIDSKIQQKVRQFISSGSESESVPDISVFKTCLIQGLDGKADLNDDGYITGSELGSYLHDNVVNYSRRAQHPQTGTINDPRLNQGDFVFALQADYLEKSAKKPLLIETEYITGTIRIESLLDGDLFLDAIHATSIKSGEIKILKNVPIGERTLELKSSEDNISTSECKKPANLITEKEYQLTMENRISQLKKQYLLKTPDELIRVNTNTMWSRHLFGGEDRIPTLVRKVSSEVDSIRNLLELSGYYDTSKDIVKEAEKIVYDLFGHTADAIRKQADKYLNQSNELTQWRNEDNSSEWEEISQLVNKHVSAQIMACNEGLLFFSHVRKSRVKTDIRTVKVQKDQTAVISFE